MLMTFATGRLSPGSTRNALVCLNLRDLNLSFAGWQTSDAYVFRLILCIMGMTNPSHWGILSSTYRRDLQGTVISLSPGISNNRMVDPRNMLRAFWSCFRSNGRTTAFTLIFILFAPLGTRGQSYDVAEDYTLDANPSGPWSYGYLTELDGTFGLLGASRTFSANNGVPIGVWELRRFSLPVVAKVLGPGTAVSDGARFTAPAGTIYIAPGADGAAENFGAVRFTVPEGHEGTYRLETTVRSLFDSTRSADADFHVRLNGQALFDQDLAPNSQASYSEDLELRAGDIVDFAVGRGPDGLTLDSGLKLEATLTRIGDDPPPPPPPPPVMVFDVSRDFSTQANPGGPWSYGWKNTFGGPFTRLTFAKPFQAENGVPLFSWQLANDATPSVAYVVGPGTAVSASGQFQAEPGTLWVTAGLDGQPQDFGVVRFTLPMGQSGIYRIETRVRDVFEGPSQGDTDFHVVHNGQEIFGRDVAPHETAAYTNEIALVEGDTVEFAVGRGADGSQMGSALKLEALLRQLDLRPPGPVILQELIDLVLATSAKVNEKSLLASLNAIQASLLKGNILATINKLHAFQRKVRSIKKPLDSSLAAQYIEMAQSIVEWLDPTTRYRQELEDKKDMPVVLDKVVRMPGVGICLEARAFPGLVLYVERSTNMVDWFEAGMSLETSDGVFQFLDHHSGKARYYRLKSMENE